MLFPQHNFLNVHNNPHEQLADQQKFLIQQIYQILRYAMQGRF